MPHAPAPKIPFSTFIDFVHAAGVKRLSIVRDAKYEKYDPRADFYKPLRLAIIAFHRKGGVDERSLADVAKHQTDAKKRTSYPGLVRAYLRFTRKHKIVWVQDPPSLTWTEGSLSVAVNPEIAVEIDGKPTFVKLWFRQERLDRHRVPTAILLLQQCITSEKLQLRHAVLDIRRCKLHVASTTAEDISVLLHSEAMAFSEMYQLL